MTAPRTDPATFTYWLRPDDNLTGLDRDDLLALGELVSEAREATLAVFDTYATAPVIDTCDYPIAVDAGGTEFRCRGTAINGRCMDHWEGQP
jgi:hypothetical protein